MTTVDFTTGTSGHDLREIHAAPAAGAADFPDGQDANETHARSAVGEYDTQPTIGVPAPMGHPSAGSDFPDGHSRSDAQAGIAVGEHNPPAPALPGPVPTADSLVLASNPWADSNAPLLALLADALDDIESMRTATANRLRQLTRTEVDKDGEERGFGLTLDNPQVATVAAMVKAIKHGDKVLKDLGYDAKAIGRPCSCLECSAIRNLQTAVKTHPLGSWIKNTPGVGEKQGARLLAAIGDPYWNTLYDRPRLVSELWAYCGLHVLPAAQASCAPQGGPGGGGKQGDPGHARVGTHTTGAGVAPTRARGQRANWSATAKKRAWLIAESCKKQRCTACRDLDGKHADDCTCSPYRVLYDEGRAKYADALHETPCRRCGPKGNPAGIGSPLSAAHQEARAYRLVMKEILKDLWRESKRLHEGGAA